MGFQRLKKIKLVVVTLNENYDRLSPRQSTMNLNELLQAVPTIDLLQLYCLRLALSDLSTNQFTYN